MTPGVIKDRLHCEKKKKSESKKNTEKHKRRGDKTEETCLEFSSFFIWMPLTWGNLNWEMGSGISLFAQVSRQFGQEIASWIIQPKLLLKKMEEIVNKLQS